MRPCAHLLFTITAVGFVFIVHTAMHTYTSVVDPDWTRIQKLCATRSVFGTRIRIHAARNRINKRQKLPD